MLVVAYIPSSLSSMISKFILLCHIELSIWDTKQLLFILLFWLQQDIMELKDS